MGFADEAGDEMTYYIKTEKKTGRNVYLIRSTICTRRKKIGTDKEYVNNDPDDAPEIGQMLVDFKAKGKILDGDLEEEPNEMEDSGEILPTIMEEDQEDPETSLPPDPDESLPADIQGDTVDPNESLQDLYNQMENEEADLDFEKIVDHSFQEGVLILKTRYTSDVLGEENIMDIPFCTFKKDIPV